MKAVVDRIENGVVVAVTDNDEVINIKIKDLGFDLKENDVITYTNGKWNKDENETKNRLNYIKKLTEDMWKN